jgi:molybdopterin-binding protein
VAPDKSPGLRVGQAAALLGVSVDTVRRWEEEGKVRIDRSAGGQRLVPIDEIQRLLGERRGEQRHLIARSSARNQMEAVITKVVADRAAASVEMQAGPFRLVALTTAESVADLGLRPGLRVVASIKATNVVVGLPQ